MAGENRVVGWFRRCGVRGGGVRWQGGGGETAERRLDKTNPFWEYSEIRRTDAGGTAPQRGEGSLVMSVRKGALAGDIAAAWALGRRS